MEFQKIRFDGKTVELSYTEKARGDGELLVEEKGADPSPLFKHVLQSFAAYVVWVIGAPSEWAESFTVRGVTIKRPEDAPRGIVVTAIRQCSRARNGTMLVNTPYLAEAKDGNGGEEGGFLPAHVAKWIDEMEQEAEAYHYGSRGEQTTLDLESENAKSFDERAAAAEVASTRKPKSRKGKAQIPGVGDVVNPDSTEVVDVPTMRQLLLTVDRDVPVDAISRWTSSEFEKAERWARYRQREIVGSLKPEEKMPNEPDCVKRSATLPLNADQWTAPAPKVDDAGVREVQEAAGRA